MPTPTLTLRKVMNHSTGIDISVPSFREVEAPLGGTSVEYEISVLTSLQSFKTSLHKENDVVHFSLFKAFREMEDLRRKLVRKFPLLKFPPLHKGDTSADIAVNERVAALDNFMKFIAEDSEVSRSSIFLQFVGINLQKVNKIYSATKDVCLDKKDDLNDKVETDGLFKKTKTDNFKVREMNVLSEFENDDSVGRNMVSVVLETGNNFSELSINNKSNDEYQENEVFPKVKLGSKCEKEDILCDKEHENMPSTTKFKEEENEDIFEEVKKIKQESSPMHNLEKNTYTGLFQSDVFSSSTLIEKTKKKEFLFDSEIASKNIFENSQGSLKLFKDQDYGEAITIEEEPLFYISQDKNPISPNSLLMPKTDLSDHLEIKAENHLEDLLHLDPLPEPKITSAMIENNEQSLVSGMILDVPPLSTPLKPVPKPRMKVLSNSNKPKIAPKCHPPKPAVSSSKPQLPPKPSTLITKSKLMVSAGSKRVNNSAEVNTALHNQTDESSLANAHLDILKYIEQEQKFREAEPSLFD